MKNGILTLAAAAALIATTACTQAGKEQNQQTSADGQQSGQQQVQAPTGAQDFLKAVTADHTFEIQAARLAQQKSKNKDVNQFASTMIKDHTKFLNDTEKVSQQFNVEVPADLPQKYQKILDSLQSESGDAFNQTYAQYMVSDHREAIQLLSNHVQASDFAPTRDLAQAALPTIQRHFNMAQDLQQRVPMRAPASVPESQMDSSGSGQ